MIAVRIPEEIRKYKEKILFGLTARQLITTIIAFAICVPLYWYGKKYISESILSWVIILIGAGCWSIGYLKINGMPMEKFVFVFIKTEILYPKKRKYLSDNAFRDWQEQAIREEMPRTWNEKRKWKKIRRAVSLERAYLMEEAEKEGKIVRDDEELITVNENGWKKKKKEKKRKEDKEQKEEKPNLQKLAEEIEEKQKKDPNYICTSKEGKILKKWKGKQVKDRKKEIEAGKKKIQKQSAQMEKRRKVKMTIPKSTQDSIPYIADYEEGMIESTPNKFSKMYQIKDINYKTGKEDEQVMIFCKLGEFLNYFSEDMRFSFCIDNRVISKEEQERKVFVQMEGDSYDRHRKEYNKVLRAQMVAGQNDVQVQKYVTVTIDADTPIEALLKFHKIDAEIITNLRRIGSDGKVLTTTERLEYYHDKYRKGHEGEFQIDYDFLKKQGISSKDYIAPSFINFQSKYIQIDDDYYSCLYLNNLPASLQDEFLVELCDNDFPVTTTMYIEPVAQDKGLKIVRRQLTGIEANKIDAEKRAIRSGYSPETIQHSIKDAHRQAETLYDDMMNKNQKMFFVTITLMVHGSTLDELQENCNILMNKARKYTCQLQTLRMQQEEGYKITWPFGYISSEVRVDRALTTESTSIFMPFCNQEIFQPGGYFYGLNQISHNMIIINRKKMKTPSGFILGSSGSGKSFATKQEILNILLNDNESTVLVIDPENEYGDFCRAFGGSVLKISADSDVYINPMDMDLDYGLDEDDDENLPIKIKKEKAIKKKSDYIMSIVERMISVGGNGDRSTITPQQKTLVDRCVRKTYREYLEHDFDKKYLPTLINLQDELNKETGEDGKKVAEAVAYYTYGSMNIFAHHTNVVLDNRLIVFNVRDLGTQLRQIALIIVFDFIWNRMVTNKNKNVRTNAYCDEIHVMFDSYYAAENLKQLYKRGRKYGLCITGITQNVEDMLNSQQARGMISNSDFIMMLNQYSDDLKILAKRLNISETQMGFVTGADEGSGLIFAENVIVPFVNRFPRDSYLYKLMSTKFGEEMTRVEIDKIIDEIMKEHEEDQTITDHQIDMTLKKMYYAKPED